jgi:deazaflavin-dependent oxidoreductase (nitroreductase family)
MSDWNKGVIEEFRAKRGDVGRPVLLLHTIGAKSGQARITPLTYHMDGERYAVVASNGGDDTNPDWYHNLVAQPIVEVEVGAEKFKAQAVIVEEPERTRIFEKRVALLPRFGEYQNRTKRPLPVILLTRLLE